MSIFDVFRQSTKLTHRVETFSINVYVRHSARDNCVGLLGEGVMVA